MLPFSLRSRAEVPHTQYHMQHRASVKTGKMLPEELTCVLLSLLGCLASPGALRLPVEPVLTSFAGGGDLSKAVIAKHVLLGLKDCGKSQNHLAGEES